MDYLQWHKTQWRVRRVVPPGLVDKIGKATLLHGTGTDDYEKALRIAAPIIAEHDKIIARASGWKPLAVHLRNVKAGSSVEWYTPPFIFQRMPGVVFDLDVASPGRDVVPWIPAKKHFTIADDGLAQPWHGFVWMNPPFGLRRGMQRWLDRFVAHGNGIAMVPGNIYVRWWQHMVVEVDVVLCVAGYVNSISPSGYSTKASFGTCLMGIGPQAVAALTLARSNGLGEIGNFR